MMAGMTPIRSVLLLLLALLPCCKLFAQMDRDGIHWHLVQGDRNCAPFAEDFQSDTAFVFVHGFRGNNGETWAHSAGNGYDQYWPYLVWNDARLRGDAGHRIRPSVYVCGYSSGPNYTLDDATSEVLRGLRNLEVTTRYTNIIFIAHSLGGVVVRNMFVHHWSFFRSKHIGIALIASPTTGSYWADFAKNANDDTFKLKFVEDNELLKALQANNGFLDSIDRNFRSLVAGVDVDGPDRPRFVIGEAVEQYSPLLRSTELPPIVPRNSSERHLGLSRTIPDSNHMSICKPADQYSSVHGFLVDFYESFLSEFSPRELRAATGETGAPSLAPDSGIPPQPGLENAPMALPPASPQPSADMAASSSVRDKIWGLTGLWRDALMQGNLLRLRYLYAPHLETYFNRGNVPAEDALSSIQNLVTSYSVRQITLTEPTFRVNTQGDVDETFCKRYHFTGSAVAPEDGAVRSYMHFRVIEGKWYLTGICDQGLCSNDAAAQELLRASQSSCMR
jgi:pimeloyl-ACP methyl ester carboxylesterase